MTSDSSLAICIRMFYDSPLYLEGKPFRMKHVMETLQISGNLANNVMAHAMREGDIAVLRTFISGDGFHVYARQRSCRWALNNMPVTTDPGILAHYRGGCYLGETSKYREFKHVY